MVLTKKSWVIEILTNGNKIINKTQILMNLDELI